MGRRSITGTKAGKFMNPTDQARKEARRKELKKNKKQRLQVRQAVIKQKDPKIIFAEMEAIDKMEYDVNNPPPYSVKVLQDKRRKLKDTWLKIYQFYQREDPKQAHEVKVMELDYERRRQAMMHHYESIMQTKNVNLNDIPLPEFSMPSSEIPLPPSSATPKSILKQPAPSLVSSFYADTEKQPPGAPPGPPPTLEEFDNDDFESGTSEANKSTDKHKKIRFDPSADMAIQQPIGMPGHSVPPPPPPVTASQIQQSLINKQYASLNRVPPPPMSAYSQRGQPQQQNQQQPQGQKQNFYNQQQQSGSKASAADATPKQTTIEAQPVLRNKIAEITRFVPTSLTVKRDNKKAVSAPQSQYAPVPSMPSQSSGPYNYMLQQQQQYATLNPLNSYRSSLAQSAPAKPLVSSLSKPAHIISTSQTISIVAAPSVQHDPKDEAYNKFMKEMEGLL